jgi:hypothetical protein
VVYFFVIFGRRLMDQSVEALRPLELRLRTGFRQSTNALPSMYEKHSSQHPDAERLL